MWAMPMHPLAPAAAALVLLLVLAPWLGPRAEPAPADAGAPAGPFLIPGAGPPWHDLDPAAAVAIPAIPPEHADLWSDEARPTHRGRHPRAGVLHARVRDRAPP